ncbi:MAG: acetyl-CoA carboxylase biotin carboxylase subunit [Ignavibacteriales bacterium]|nr:MAG: acetyl-CoA carboxylase biotin carboxylase subunit [Ignavibacteriaceae bacterium]MBW7872366.1 acetyl-CoA carboxylase biotin carboxylase subunit [Ignavibacteria bacterium]MCZ2142649.1 acetyl-CoA carboxylase biotin carboxylase subunit [Ignavibacteriales bacterium]OQY76072.1 MAG: hypothetical protein B6D45_04680 [Ignavibacteriales bacterium UTCHB3]MBV6445488.1 Acetyl-/propionyl-coenzyme A carboxylase alpha chain [Ignavibacteriaceae bacterium]
MYFKKILVVNRGEIALRVFRGARELGIKTVAVYSDADVNSLYVKYADESYHLPGTTAGETYLNIEKIIDTARKCGADAIHPGYGFLSERASFIQAVEEAGITFIGPSSKSVEMMGSKTGARRIMQEHGVPFVPGTTDPVESIEEAKAFASKIGYPVLIKASAGGGGKGMKKVSSPEEIDEAFFSAKREALSAFGDSAVYIEKFIEEPKHIEVQILGDKFGNYIHVFERECSVQRRHQKIIEESPSPFVDKATREKITKTAIEAAKACNYYNAGTIEFLMDSKRNFFFLEMNTRLQVEHPVTEMISGLDLVKEQIKIAAGEKLSYKQEDLKINGHAIECRVYAEDPDNNFLPSTGRISFHRIPTGPGVRVDEGIEGGSDITMYYDPMLSKVIAHGSDRSSAIQRVKMALESYSIAGVQTNIAVLLWLLNNRSFLSGKYSINLIDKEFLPLVPGAWKEQLDNGREDAAVALSAILRERSRNSANNLRINEVLNDNNWLDTE